MCSIFEGRMFFAFWYAGLLSLSSLLGSEAWWSIVCQDRDSVATSVSGLVGVAVWSSGVLWHFYGLVKLPVGDI
jgi:hypothetical protein